jgi:predicted nucleic acid-binding protein
VPSLLKGTGKTALIGKVTEMLLDTSAWVEFFMNTSKREKVWAVLKANECFTSLITLAEISNWCWRNNLKEQIEPYVEGIKANSKILGLDEEILLNAGKLNYERKILVKDWGMVDSVLLSTAQVYGLGILTKDFDFSDLPNVEILS